jgi:hypothetical protein
VGERRTRKRKENDAGQSGAERTRTKTITRNENDASERGGENENDYEE